MKFFDAIFLTAFLLFLNSCGNSGGKYFAVVKSGDKYGYINEKGDFVIDPQFDEAWSFIRGSAVVKKDGKFALINKQGDFLGDTKYDSIIPFSASCCIAQIDSLFGFLEYGTGKMLIAPQYQNVFNYTDELCVVQKGRALGIVNSDAKLVCPVVMQDFRPMFGPAAISLQHDTTDEVMMLLAISNGGMGAKLGLIGRNGKSLVEPKYDDIFDDLPSGFYYPFIANEENPADSISDFDDMPTVPPGKYGIIDTTGKIIAEPRFDDMPVYGDGMFRVRLGEKYGYLDVSGKMIIEPAYEYATAFSEGKAIASIGSKASIIDKKGNVLVENLGPGAGMYRFFCGLARCRSVDGRYGFLDVTGKRVIDTDFDVADDFENNRAIVSLNNKYGLIDITGKFVVEPQFDFFFNLGNGYYQTKNENGKAGVVDSLGKIILPQEFDEVFHFQKYWFAVEKDGRSGCYDLNGKEIYPPVSARSIYFFDGRCLVTGAKGGYGMIDSTGRAILPVEYDSIGIFFKGYATIQQKGKYGAADSTGKIVIKPKYDELRPIVNGMAVYLEKGKYGYLDPKGNVLIEAKFEDAAVMVNPDRRDFE